MNKPASILVAGRATVDLIMEIDHFSDRGEKFRANDCRFVVGGPGANASIAMARFGAQPLLITYLGDDMIGNFIRQSLIDESVDMSMSLISAGTQSSVSAAFVDSGGERQTFNFPGKGFTELSETLKSDYRPCAVLADNRHPELTNWAIAFGKKRNVPIIIDAEAPFTENHANGATHLAFSRQGLDSFAPSCDIETGLRRAEDVTGCWVCVTDGENGVWYLQNNVITNIPAFIVRTVDSVGAGDVWHGIFSLCLGEEMSEGSAIKVANAAAAMKCRKFGGISASPDRQSCYTFMEEH
ncbi:PfkB family carbohydrate kinase [Alphaproteobacteria bacterium]|jgi:sulfofructose kinase|nr:PfkB family carbohydrate kinase [Alphaproteobacteria bacterium]